MYLIQEILVSEDVVHKQFQCDVSVCKGACCYKGDWGAPLEQQEIDIISAHLKDIKPFLTAASQDLLERDGFHAYYKGMDSEGTVCHDDGACVFMTTKEGIAQCGIEQASRAGALDYLKPISCHLYPIRVKKIEGVGFEALNYSEWDICRPALASGQRNRTSLTAFAKDAIIRAYGEDFYEALWHASQQPDPNAEPSD